jgi:hypothetical protein
MQVRLRAVVHRSAAESGAIVGHSGATATRIINHEHLAARCGKVFFTWFMEELMRSLRPAICLLGGLFLCAIRPLAAESLGDATSTTGELIARMPDSLHCARAVISSANRHVAMICSRAGSDVVVRDSLITAVYGRAGSTVANFTHGGAHLLFDAAIDGRQVLVVDTVAGPRFDEIAGLIVSSRDDRFAYAARTGRNWFVVSETGTSPALEELDLNSVAMSDAGSHLAYAAKLGGVHRLFVDGAIRFTVDAVVCRPRFSPDEQHLACGIMRDGTTEIYRDSLRIAWFPKCKAVPSPVFSRDGAHLWYATRSRKQWTAFVDGSRLGEWSAPPQSAEFDTLGRAYYLVRADRKPVQWDLMCDSVRLCSYACESVLGPFVSRSGQHIACVLQFTERFGDQYAIDLDGNVGARCDELSYPVFSPDGACCAYTAVRGATYGKRPLLAPTGWSPYVDHSTATRGVFVNNVQLTQFTNVVPGTVNFASDSALTFAVQRELAFYRVTYPIR